MPCLVCMHRHFLLLNLLEIWGIIMKKQIAKLSALALVLSLFTLLPVGSFKAYAVSGTGSESDPYVVSTFDELRS